MPLWTWQSRRGNINRERSGKTRQGSVSVGGSFRDTIITCTCASTFWNVQGPEPAGNSESRWALPARGSQAGLQPQAGHAPRLGSPRPPGARPQQAGGGSPAALPARVRRSRLAPRPPPGAPPASRGPGPAPRPRRRASIYLHPAPARRCRRRASQPRCQVSHPPAHRPARANRGTTPATPSRAARTPPGFEHLWPGS